MEQLKSDWVILGLLRCMHPMKEAMLYHTQVSNFKWEKYRRILLSKSKLITIAGVERTLLSYYQSKNHTTNGIKTTLHNRTNLNQYCISNKTEYKHALNEPHQMLKMISFQQSYLFQHQNIHDTAILPVSYGFLHQLWNYIYQANIKYTW